MVAPGYIIVQVILSVCYLMVWVVIAFALRYESTTNKLGTTSALAVAFNRLAVGISVLYTIVCIDPERVHGLLTLPAILFLKGNATCLLFAAVLFYFYTVIKAIYITASSHAGSFELTPSTKWRLRLFKCVFFLLLAVSLFVTNVRVVVTAVRGRQTNRFEGVWAIAFGGLVVLLWLSFLWLCSYLKALLKAQLKMELSELHTSSYGSFLTDLLDTLKVLRWWSCPLAFVILVSQLAIGVSLLEDPDIVEPEDVDGDTWEANLSDLWDFIVVLSVCAMMWLSWEPRGDKDIPQRGYRRGTRKFFLRVDSWAMSERSRRLKDLAERRQQRDIEIMELTLPESPLPGLAPSSSNALLVRQHSVSDPQRSLASRSQPSRSRGPGSRPERSRKGRSVLSHLRHAAKKRHGQTSLAEERAKVRFDHHLSSEDSTAAGSAPAADAAVCTLPDHAAQPIERSPSVEYSLEDATVDPLPDPHP